MQRASVLNLAAIQGSNPCKFFKSPCAFWKCFVNLISSQVPLPSFPEDNNILFKEGNEFSSCLLYFLFRTALAPAYKPETWPTVLSFHHMLTFLAFRVQLYNLVLNACSSYVNLSCLFGYPFKIQKHQKRFHSEFLPPLLLQFSFEDCSFKRGEKKEKETYVARSLHLQMVRRLGDAGKIINKYCYRVTSVGACEEKQCSSPH